MVRSESGQNFTEGQMSSKGQRPVFGEQHIGQCHQNIKTGGKIAPAMPLAHKS